MKENNIGIFEEVREFPDPSAARRFAALVGLDDKKDRLLKEARLLLDPQSLTAWSAKHHGGKAAIVNLFRDRPPLFIFAGDVGTGKTALAKGARNTFLCCQILLSGARFAYHVRRRLTCDQPLSNRDEGCPETFCVWLVWLLRRINGVTVDQFQP